MVCLGLEPGAAGWKAQTNPLSYSGTPLSDQSYKGSMILNYDSRVVPDFKIPNITTLDT